jgi:hypothetical protein
MYRTAPFVTVQEHFIAYCGCREAVKLFRFLLSPYSLIGPATMCSFSDLQRWSGGLCKFQLVAVSKV